MAKRIRHSKVSFIGIKATEKISQFNLTAADITSSHSAPVVLIAAPGVNKAVFPTKALLQFKYGSVQFTGGGAGQLVYHGATTNLLTGTILAATVQAAANARISLGAQAAGLALALNTGIDFYSATADFAAGDSTAILTVWYTEYELS